MSKNIKQDEHQYVSYERAKVRNDLAREGLKCFFENAIRPYEYPCYSEQCRRLNADCDSCEWYDFDETGLWELSSPEKLERLYNEEDLPEYPSNPFRYSRLLGEWIVEGACQSYVSGSDIASIADEYELLASLCYSYRFVDGDVHDHAHSFSGVVQAVLYDPENFYIPFWAKDDYSAQELQFLEILRERLCRDNEAAPKVDIVWGDEKDEEKQKEIQSYTGNTFSDRVAKKLAQLRGEEND